MRVFVAFLVVALVVVPVPSFASLAVSDEVPGGGVDGYLLGVVSEPGAQGGGLGSVSVDGEVVQASGLLVTGVESRFVTFSAVSAGVAHSCGVRTDGSVVCWGANAFGQARAPGGSFSAVSTGQEHSCGVRTDGSVVCWGNNALGQTSAPGGPFTAVSGGWRYSCGVRADGSVVCWGNNDDEKASAPEGSFTAVSAGAFHSCGLRADGTILCWGDNSGGRASAPEGSFSAVSAGGVLSCGVRADGSVVCWGADSGGQVRAPGGAPSAVSVGMAHSCGVRADGSVGCWRRNVLGPAGSFSAVSAGLAHVCGLRTEGSVVCWANDSYGQASAPEGSFTAVSAGGAHSCGVRADGSVVCWGADHLGQASAPEGSFTAVSAGGEHSCGLRADGSILCWGYNSEGQAGSPEGSFTAVSAGLEHSCAVRADGSVECWGDNAVFISTAGSGGSGPAGAVVDRFADDAGSPHEDDINRIAELGITLGCATRPEPRFCPDGHVTRAEMSVFLLRAIGQPDPQPTGANLFSDVPDDVWYTKYALRLAQMGVDTGENGEWRPVDPLTRLEMAQWLGRMFDHITPATSPRGLFGDVDTEHWEVVEGLYHVGVTRGCSAQPLLYCPDQPVTRAQMASFIIRALSITPTTSKTSPVFGGPGP